ncbi:hypothetical protein KFE25_001846 [Diacronema lutheri]|uniref:Uncharacterized protein n=1 Tax=Diacronema lutheri TaxID=2081491 RepID=A0A8J6CD16_DIALT|nr:hypothetical protein KFE25_001846 [Diacronema lutheri]
MAADSGERAEHSAFRELVQCHLYGRADGVALLTLAGACIYAEGCLLALVDETAERRSSLVGLAADEGGADGAVAAGLDLLGRHFVCVERWTDGFHAVSAARKGVGASGELRRQTLLGMHVRHSVLAVAHAAALGGSDGQEARAMALHLADILRGGPAPAGVP